METFSVKFSYSKDGGATFPASQSVTLEVVKCNLWLASEMLGEETKTGEREIWQIPITRLYVDLELQGDQFGSSTAVLPASFTGSGLCDLSAGGSYTGTAAATFDVVIDGTGSPDTFKWRKDGGSFTSGVTITGAAQTLSDGVTVTFGALTGHTLSDSWSFSALAFARLVLLEKWAAGNVLRRIQTLAGASGVAVMGWDQFQSATNANYVVLRSEFKPDVQTAERQKVILELKTRRQVAV